jgi:preprotein translocase subunit SecG
MSGIASVVLVIHILVALAMIGVILLQRSEGGALGGLGGGSGSFLSARSAGNVLTRATTILVIAFFVTSMTLTVLGRHSGPKSLDLSAGAAKAPVTAPQSGTPANPPPASSPAKNSVPDLPGFGEPANPASPPADAAPAAGSAQPATMPATAPSGDTPALPKLP